MEETIKDRATAHGIPQDIYVINCFLASIFMNKCERNQQALIDLLEFYLLFGICDTHAAEIMKV